MDKKYDAILCLERPLNENMDSRNYNNSGKYIGPTQGFTQYVDADDPLLYTSYSFGNTLRNSLSSMGNGYSCKVNDFKKWVVVEVSHHNTVTGKTVSKTFLIVFKDKGDGIVLSTHNRFRTIHGVEQAATYIKSACGSLRNDTQNKIG